VTSSITEAAIWYD